MCTSTTLNHFAQSIVVLYTDSDWIVNIFLSICGNNNPNYFIHLAAFLINRIFKSFISHRIDATGIRGS